MEIERKFLVEHPPKDYASFPFRQIEQAYLCTEPVIRIRREDDSFYLTYKGSGLLSREEYNLPLTADAYSHLLPKADGNVLTKKRYLLPLSDSGLTIELDVFEGRFAGLILAEVEFPTEEAAHAFMPPEWFAKDVTLSGEYQNSRLSCIK
ncbi:MAG: CYTH domain-containing protein [Lachnospiraceae bacterium]|nr:CYTH domain-containing protein [Lachnospiraceae bacterium]